MLRIAQTLQGIVDVEIWGIQGKQVLGKSNEKGIQVRRFQTYFKRSFLFYLELNLRYSWALLKENYQIHYVVDVDTLLASFIGKWFTSKKYIFDAHELFTEVPELHNKKLKKAIWNLISIIGLRNNDLNITVNKALAQHLSEKHNQAFEVIRNMPPTIKAAPLSDRFHSNILIYQGAVNVGRGIEVYLETMKRLPEYELWILGEGDLYDELKQVAIDQRITNVKFFGYILPDHLESYTRKAKIGLNLIEHYSLNYYYSLANKFFDYVQSGLPAINMDYPVYSMLNKEFEVSILLHELSQESLYQAIRLLENRAIYEDLVANCFLAASKWNWENEGAKLLKLVNDKVI